MLLRISIASLFTLSSFAAGAAPAQKASSIGKLKQGIGLRRCRWPGRAGRASLFFPTLPQAFT